MQVAVITVQREPMYLYATLESLIASVPWGARRDGRRWIDVFIGTPNASEIAERVFPIARPHKIDVDLWNLIEPLPPRLRAVGNAVAALRACDADGADDLVLFEDDIMIKPGWPRALEVDDIIWGAGSIDFDPEACFVSLFSHRDLRSPGIAALLQKPIAHFYGTCGLFVPAAHRRPLAEVALALLQSPNPHPIDLRPALDEIVRTYVNAHAACNLAITIPSYVDHVGDVSIVNPTYGPRRAPMF